MSEAEREVLEVDVLFVGAGPACLAGALHLSKLISQHDAAIDAGSATGDKIGEVEIAVIEKGSDREEPRDAGDQAGGKDGAS